MAVFSTNCFVTEFVGGLVSIKLLKGRKKDKKFESQEVQAEAYHLEANKSDPMLGFFCELIKIYFLMWSV